MSSNTEVLNILADKIVKKSQEQNKKGTLAGVTISIALIDVATAIRETMLEIV